MTFPGRLDGESVSLDVTPLSLVAGGWSLAYADVDALAVEGHTITLTTATAEATVVDQLGRRHDEFVRSLWDAWRRARRADLLQWTGDAPIDEYEVHDTVSRAVVLFPDGLTVEGWSGAPEIAPFSLVDGVDRDGYTITIRLRGGLDPVVIRSLGRRTDEFVKDLDTARNSLTARTGEAYAALDPALSGFAAPDGWAVDRTSAGAHWNALRHAVVGDRAEEIDVLERLAGERLRLGIKAQNDGASMPFALAPVSGRVAVEGTAEGEARATFVFATDDVDRLNAVLLLTSFRREAISLPEDQLGRWAVAVRTLAVVRWARAALVARVVHDDSWEKNVSAALSA